MRSTGAVRWRPSELAVGLARAHAMIVPSMWEEPFPLVTIEGALARVPLVASDVGGIGEGMSHDEHALLFAREDARMAAEALASTLTEHDEPPPGCSGPTRARRTSARRRTWMRRRSFVNDAYTALRAHTGVLKGSRPGR